MSVIVNKSSNVQLGIAWNWQYDADFVEALDRACGEAGLSCYRVGPHNLKQTCLEVEALGRRFAWFLDRASDDDARFLQLHQLLQQRGTRFFNAQHHYQRSIEKANLHAELGLRGLQLPLTVILPAHDTQPQFDPLLLDGVPKPFVVKPSRGGGGVGVMLDVSQPDQVMQTRARLRQQRFLVQQRIEPQRLGGRRAWFRVYHVCGDIIPCWWDDLTHRYGVFVPADRGLVNLDELTRIVRIIAEVAQLDFFSTEIALDTEQRYVVIDYVNDPCDMRLQSKCFDGVPDSIVRQIIASILGKVRREITRPAPAADRDLWP